MDYCAEGSQTAIKPMSTGPLIAAVCLLSLATFVVILDATIINVAVPHIAGSFAASASEATWVITSYAVAEALTVPLSGWLATRFGLVRTLVASIGAFAAFSALCGIASSLQLLVALRVLQGLSGGPLIPISQALILRISPPKKVEMVMGLWMMTSIVAPIAGPLLGGALADTIGWRWAFYLNVPIASMCAALALVVFRGVDGPPRHQKIDYVGLVLLAIWVSSLQIFLDTGEDKDWFASPTICFFAIASIVGFVFFVIWEVTEDEPIVDLRILRHRGFTVCCGAMFFAFGAFFASLVLLPLWLQLGMGYTATSAGEILACQGLLGVVAAPIAAMLMKRVDARLLMATGLFILAASIFWRSGFSTAIAFNNMVWPQLLMGLGLPLFFVPLMTVSLQAVNLEETASASGIINFVRTIAGAVATSMVVSVWSNTTIQSHARLVATIHPPEGSSRGKLHALASLSSQALQWLDTAAWQQSMVLAANIISVGLALVLMCSAAAVFLSPAQPR